MLKKTLYSLLLLACLTGCKSDHNKFTIEGTVPSTKYDGEWIYLVPAEGANSSNVDSTKIKNASFTFKGDVERIAIIRTRPILRLSLQELLVVTEPGDIKVVLNSPSSSHVLLDAYAVKGLQSGQIKYLYALSHLSPTAIYGVTFERGVSVLYGDRCQLYISGTASIDNKGEVLHKGDVLSQARRMCENVEKLLEEGGSGFQDLAQIIIYLRDAADYKVIKHMLEKQFPEIPKQYVLASVCRPSWLIEMECIAVRKNNNPEFGNL